MKTTANKAVASGVTVLSGWSTFVLTSDPSPITPGEWGWLITGIATVFVTWLTPNETVTPWTPPRLLDTTTDPKDPFR